MWQQPNVTLQQTIGAIVRGFVRSAKRRHAAYVSASPVFCAPLAAELWALARAKRSQ